MAEEYDYQAYFGDVSSKLRDTEEKQRILKDRVIIIGQNLVDIKEKTGQDILEIKKQIEEIKSSLDKVRRFLENFSEEFSKFAKKEDLDILIKQAKMFQPLDFVRKSDLEKLKRK